MAIFHVLTGIVLLVVSRHEGADAFAQEHVCSLFDATDFIVPLAHSRRRSRSSLGAMLDVAVLSCSSVAIGRSPSRPLESAE